jgi:hypothetical protein
MTDLINLLVPFRLGSKVKVAASNPYASEWPGTYVVTGMEWDYRRGPYVFNITIASDEDIVHGHGATDGWSADDLTPA